MKNKNSQTNKIREDLGATLQAVVEDHLLQFEFSETQENNFFSWSQNLILDEKKVLLPQIKNDDLIKFHRASADLAVCYLLFHNQKIHQTQKFSGEEQILFDEFEKIRVVINVKDSYLGIVKNILRKIEDDVSRPLDSDFKKIPLILLNQFFKEKILPRTKNLISNLEKNLSKNILKEIKNLDEKIFNQENFSKAVGRLIDLMRKEEEADEKEKTESKNQQQKTEEDLVNFGQENGEQKEEEKFSSNEEDGEKKSEKEKIEEKISNLQDDKQAGEARLRVENSDFEEDKIEFKNAYRIFTNKFDEVIFPQKLISKNELEILRDQLDLKIAKLLGISKKMSLKLKRKLLSKKNSLLERDSNRGILDRRKLTRLVIDPMIDDLWINNKNHEYNDTALTILLDNSGSMRGNPIVMSALACEIIAEILEKYAVKTEIIGFTTADWKGGRVRKLWELSGKPHNPGRLNELRHIIYKPFNQSFKKSKINLGLMLKEGILKENIDGEALLFARSRLMQQDQKRKILMVISDGTPVDDSTVLANDSEILSTHLCHVINNIEKKSEIEIVGIGIGHSTDDFYKNSIAIKSLEELGDVMIEKITNLL